MPTPHRQRMIEAGLAPKHHASKQEKAEKTEPKTKTTKAKGKAKSSR